MRVIAGSLRGRRLRTPRGGAVRPTYDRVRESLFGIIESRIPGARVLDLYAGTGSLGIECLSRGAEHATFVERDRGVMAVLRGNIDALGLGPRATPVLEDVARYLGRGPGAGFDIALADPPYGGSAAEATVRLLAAWGGLAEDSIVVVEHAGRGPLDEAVPLRRWRSERYGSTVVDFFEVRGAGPAIGEKS